MITQEFLQKLDCGLIRANIKNVQEWNSDIFNLIENSSNCFQYPVACYTYDIKVHMLMPSQYPCIPGWHLDLIPRNQNNKQDFSRIQPENKMYLWLSGTPITEFKDGRIIEPQKFIAFTQEDEHRGTASKEHTWRMFIRMSAFEHYKPIKNSNRRHCQVYLDSEKFKW